MAQSWESLQKLAQACEPESVLVVGPTDTALELALTEAVPGVRVHFTEHLEHELAPSAVDTGQLIRPPGDRGLRAVEHEVEDLHYILPYLEQRRVAVQAGGAYGLWPLRLAEVFRTVYTFEPEPRNFDALVANTAGHPDIIRMQAALGDRPELVKVVYDHTHRDNAGAGYTRPGGTVPTLRLDDLGLVDVDLVWLDVEGQEHAVLVGARKLIQLERPVVVVECKPLPHTKGDPFAAVHWLEKQDYGRVRNLHRDVLMVPKERLHRETPPSPDVPERFQLVHIGVHGSEDEVSAAISRGYQRLEPGGWITGTHYQHKNADVMRAVASHFNLMHVVAAEGAVWMSQKPPL